MGYAEGMISRLWDYRSHRFPDKDDWFDRRQRTATRPPVFLQRYASANVLRLPNQTDAQYREVLATIRVDDRHRWFRSMRSSQALAQSVFGQLKALRSLHVLKDVTTEAGWRPFGGLSRDGREMALEQRVDWLGEPRPTSIDVSIRLDEHVAIECKLTEAEVGSCSRPKLDSTEPEYCDGRYAPQHGRIVPCALSHIGVRYWEFIPRLLRWDVSTHGPCRLNPIYQLARNLLAASVRADGSIGQGRAILLYDANNPAFARGGSVEQAFHAIRSALFEPGRVDRLTWQAVVASLRGDSDLERLREELGLKYGL
jgi:hypothetical protein